MTGNDPRADATALERNLAEAEDMIRGAHKAMAAGEQLDLAPLGALIADLCDGLADKARASADPDAVCRRLEAMVGELNRMEALLRTQAQAGGLQDPDKGGTGGE